jgi:hypothetical protein
MRSGSTVAGVGPHLQPALGHLAHGSAGRLIALIARYSLGDAQQAQPAAASIAVALLCKGLSVFRAQLDLALRARTAAFAAQRLAAKAARG